MPLVPGDPRELGYYFALGQVGLEMVVPIGVGAVIDHYAGSGPWGSVIGAALGLVLGFVHLITLLNRRNERENDSRREPRQ